MANSGFTQVPDPSNPGTCCDCAKQQGCNCGGAGCSLACRTFANLATFCGFPEYVPSSPPKYYRSMTLSGSFSASSSTDGLGCTHPSQCSSSTSYSGSNVFDKKSCALTVGGAVVRTGSCGFNFSNTGLLDVHTSDVSGLGPVGFNIQDHFDAVSHSLVVTFPGVCVTGGTQGAIPISSTCAAIISDQDTVDDAIARATPSPPVWAEPNQGNCLLNTSFVLPNTTGPSFAFRKAQIQASLPLATAKHTYQVTIGLVERAAGSSGTFVPHGTMEFTVTAPDTGPTISPWVDLPMETGSEIGAASCVVVDIT